MYVTPVPRGNETLRLEAILLASLPALASFQKLTPVPPHVLYASWPLCHPPVMSFFGQITLVSELSHAGGVPLAFSDAASRSLEELGLHT